MVEKNGNYIIIDGKSVAFEIKQEIKTAVHSRIDRGLKAPHLAAILVGNDGASETYVNSKIKTCGELGFTSSLLRLGNDVSQKELLNAVNKLNDNTDIDGFIVQLPLPTHIDEQKVIEAIDPSKDVDGFHPINVGKMSIGLPALVSATPSGIIELIKRYNIDTDGKDCVVIGRSNIVGKPIAQLLGQNTNPGNCTVTCCHSHTKNLKEVCRRADIIISAIGKPSIIIADMVKDGAVVIDVGITRVKDSSKKSGYRLSGDVDFNNVAPKCSYITPVPGGVGPMTIVSLMLNTLKAVEMKENLKGNSYE